MSAAQHRRDLASAPVGGTGGGASVPVATPADVPTRATSGTGSEPAVRGGGTPDGPAGGATGVAQPVHVALRRQADALLLFHADTLDGWESLRIATQNRIRTLTSTEDWGKGVPEGLPEVQVALEGLAELEARERGATLALQRSMRRHPLGPYVKGLKGVGDKQAARLLAAIGDPYWHGLEDRPRTVSELWAFCGYHVIHSSSGGRSGSDTHSASAPEDAEGRIRGDDRITSALGTGDYASRHDDRDTHQASARGDHDTGGHTGSETHISHAVGDEGRVGGQPTSDAQGRTAPGVAPRRQRGVRCNWSGSAKKRAWLVVDSAIKQRCAACRAAGKARAAEGDASYHPPAEGCTCVADGCVLRAEYDRGRVKYASAVKPDGTPLTPGHQDARARRLAAKLLLKLLWLESKALHELAGEGGTG